MLHVLKLFFIILRELIFDNKEEAKFNSPKFNTRKFMAMLLLLLSMFGNVWLIQRFYYIATELITTRNELNELKGSIKKQCLEPSIISKSSDQKALIKKPK